jgi:predicted CXXCH cytochrome family protein
MYTMKSSLRVIILIAIVSLCGNTASYAENQDCAMCHADLAQGRVVHPALQMGCTVCHTSITSTEIPHKKINNNDRGLSSNEPELCLNCHDRALFEGKKQVHAPAKSGFCTGCHSPHSSDIEKLLIVDMPQLCFQCHEETRFTGKAVHKPAKIGLCISCHAGHQSDREKLLTKALPELCFDCHDNEPYSKKNVHAPLIDGTCLSCHSAHASEDIHLLYKRPIQVCLDCHTYFRNNPHVLVGFMSLGHPVGAKRKTKKPVKDPARKSREFYCGSCHDPHSSDWRKLYRYEAASNEELCAYCHDY